MKKLLSLFLVFIRLLPASAHAEPRTESSAITPSVKDPNRHEGFLNRIKEGPIGILFLGDSITDGWPGGGKDSWDKFAPYHPADFGISVDRTEHVLWRITNGELDGITPNPKVVVIMIGTNNIGHFGDEKPEWAAGGVKAIVDTVRQKLPDSKILLLAIFPRENHDSPNRLRVNEVNKIIAHLDDGKTIRYLDFGAKYLDENGDVRRDLMPDQLHPNAQGYEIWYEAMEPLLKEMMQ